MGGCVVLALQSDDTLSKVRSIISQQLNADMEKVSPDAKFVDLGADSLDTVEIMMALEEQFDITLDEEGAENIATVQEAADMIEQFLQVCMAARVADYPSDFLYPLLCAHHKPKRSSSPCRLRHKQFLYLTVSLLRFCKHTHTSWKLLAAC